ncbi:hypothetical protein DL768_004134 [Monosporascus sp. mg162]|nr:hypothetical protein DL768_004134 [Monosporascus sp. mg162]
MAYNSDPDVVVTFLDNPPRFMFDGNKRMSFEIFNAKDCPGSEGHPNIQIGHLLSNATSSTETFAVLDAWVKDCTEHHSVCSTKDGSLGFMPKRVVDVRFGKTCLREGVVPQRYVCLSHCWGRNQSQIKTLSSNIHEFKKDIPKSMLSRTFQDATDATRRLGIDYIWIDSLCIIQDSAEDWATESLQMGDIYEHGLLTIAATSSSDGSGGLYRVRDPAHISFRPVLGDSIYVRRRMPLFIPNAFGAAPTSWPLLDRGWVFQEMSLSSRVVHFGEQEIIWQCRMGRKSESGSNDVADWSQQGIDFMHSVSNGLPSQRHWYDVVQEYSQLSLTFERDRLPALAAMAQRIAETRPGVSFLAGLWQDTLLEDLLWEVTYGNKAKNRPTQRMLPSWSWASVRSPVHWFARGRVGPLHKLPCVKLLEIKVKPVGSPFLGQYAHAELLFKGPLIPTTLGVLHQYEFMGPGSASGSSATGETMKIHQFTADYENNLQDSNHVPNDTSVCILPLLTHHGGPYYTCCLALRPTQKSMAHFERLGLVLLKYCDSNQEKDRVNNMTLETRLEYFTRYPGLINAYFNTLPVHQVVIT